MKDVRPSHLIGEEWIDGLGEEFSSRDPATGNEVWRGKAAAPSQIDSAVAAARSAFRSWRDSGFERRLEKARAFARGLDENCDELARLISLEIGKPLWESRSEVGSMIAKVEISAEAYGRRCVQESRAAGDALSWTRFRPHGVVAVFGPYNFPGHIANGHIVPALLAGNTVVFKPSEKAPATGCRTVELWREAGLPPGVLNLVQGGRPTGEDLAAHANIDGLFFTGSHQTGMALHRQFAERPEKILALEMGGNNPLLVFEPQDLEAAVLITVQSAFLTAGQRCTCARRLIVPDTKENGDFLDRLCDMTRRIRVGAFTDDPEPFMGPVAGSVEAVLGARKEFVEKGGKELVACRLLREGTGFLSPGIMDVTDVGAREDREIFGPFLQVIRVADFAAGLAEANRTRFGLAAGLVSRRRDLWEEFSREAMAGVINWNQQLTGASSRAPFGGIGESGNHRPSGYFAADYCSCPIAVMEREEPVFPERLPVGIEGGEMA